MGRKSVWKTSQGPFCSLELNVFVDSQIRTETKISWDGVHTTREKCTIHKKYLILEVYRAKSEPTTSGVLLVVRTKGDASRRNGNRLPRWITGAKWTRSVYVGLSVEEVENALTDTRRRSLNFVSCGASYC